MTKEEISSVKEAIGALGLNCTKFPKRIEVRIPKVRFPGVYLSVPTDSKGLKVQLYLNQTGIAFIEKLSLRPFAMAGDDMHKVYTLNEVKTMPETQEISDLINSVLNDLVCTGVVREPELVG